MIGFPTPDAFPVDLHHHYDDLDVTGNDGWTLDRLIADLRRTGRITTPLDIGFSATELARGNRAVYVFDGQHRLAAARARGLFYVPVRSAWRPEDAVPVRGIPDENGLDVGEIGFERSPLAPRT